MDNFMCSGGGEAGVARKTIQEMMQGQIDASNRQIGSMRQQLEAANQRELELLAVNAEITSAAQAVIDRWETPLWKDVKPTGVFIYALRDAIQIEPSQALREYKSNVLEEAVGYFKSHGYTDGVVYLSALISLAEEWRKK